MQMHRLAAVLVCVASFGPGGIGQFASAAGLGLDFANAIDRFPVADSNYGWSFTVTSPIIIDGLGLWDTGSNGLLESHDVGLWLTSTPIPEGVLVASASVSNAAGVPVSSMSTSGRWLFSSVSAVTLNPGTYIVGAVYHAGPTTQFDSLESDAFTLVTAPGVQYGTPREIHNTPNLAMPTMIGLNEHQGFFGPNFRVVVPEPGSSCGLLLTPLLLLSRRGRASN